MSPSKRIHLPSVGEIGGDLREARETIARYQGAVSRWCDLTGNPQAVPTDGSKTEAEFTMFENHLRDLSRARAVQF